MTIRVLPLTVQQRIAAGEVVDRPASVVKELIENSIDAGARAITVQARNGGLSLIRVADDGSGMSQADAPLALKRFSTSKIHSLEDLTSIQTLGFRGEALSSIAAVARIEILTRAKEEIEGSRVCAASDTMRIEPAASPVGASVTVRDLFAHLPARRRFLKSRTRECELIQQAFTRYALAYPQIAFRLVIDERERLIAPRASPLARISAVMGHDVAEEMLPIEWQALDLRIQGFISRPTIGRSRRDGQHFCVNGRPIRAGLLAVMLERPYAGRLPPGRRPLAAIQITMNPHYVDINVHPQKAEVRLAQERTVYGAMIRAVSAALCEYPRDVGESEGSWPFTGIEMETTNEVGEASALYALGRPSALAQLHNTYILAQTPDGLAVVDQHAAHEQVLLEQLGRGEERIALSPPARLDLTPRQGSILERIAAVLHDLGIEVEPFGGRAFVIRTLPAPLRGQSPRELVVALIEEGERLYGNDAAQRDQLAAKAACLSAIKAGDPLTTEQMQHLLDNLSMAWSPVSCPHGRPALVCVSMEELARRFDR